MKPINYLKIFFVFTIFLFGANLSVVANEYECALKSHGISHSLTIDEDNGDLIGFDYIAVSLLNSGPPYPSCSFHASLQGEDDRTIWVKKSSTLVVKFINPIVEDDHVNVKKMPTGFLFDFSRMNPLNCGQSSGIAEKISISFKIKKCRVYKLRN